MVEVPVGLRLRPGTNDGVIFEAVFNRNEYRLPDRLRPNSVVIDIGAHAGIFSHLALVRGAGAVYAFEPEFGNFQQAQANLSKFGDRVDLRNLAVWRSDMNVARLPFTPSADMENAGGGSVVWETEGPGVTSIPFDEIVALASNNGQRRIDLLKIDCEGAEFPILLTSSRLGDIDRIVGEYHELKAEPPRHARVNGVPEFTLASLLGALETAGFQTTFERQAGGAFGDLGLFFAERPAKGGLLNKLIRVFRISSI